MCIRHNVSCVNLTLFYSTQRVLYRFVPDDAAAVAAAAHAAVASDVWYEYVEPACGGDLLSWENQMQPPNSPLTPDTVAVIKVSQAP